MASTQPGRADSFRPVPALFFEVSVSARVAARVPELLILLAVCGWIVGCAAPRAGSGSAEPHPALKELWRDYRQLREHSALVIAGDLSRGRWVAGAAGGRPSSADAEVEALVECRKQRAKKRMQDACTLYAVGSEVVWTGR
jgi:hypothetical protein